LGDSDCSDLDGDFRFFFDDFGDEMLGLVAGDDFEAMVELATAAVGSALAMGSGSNLAHSVKVIGCVSIISSRSSPLLLAGIRRIRWEAE